MPTQGITPGFARGSRRSSGFRLVVVTALSVTGSTLEARARRPCTSPSTVARSDKKAKKKKIYRSLPKSSSQVSLGTPNVSL
ncbi:hypothetical protein TIFTF001_029273 [Ficus carica]|uniref:Uncharacterized protein n=1 Tax=Ficus carica TaxID=3494 RepID=A0AA88DRH7_FICCA|nr:hypothetical protein TIFTF001_029273 [Ficus carica]